MAWPSAGLSTFVLLYLPCCALWSPLPPLSYGSLSLLLSLVLDYFFISLSRIQFFFFFFVLLLAPFFRSRLTSPGKDKPREPLPRLKAERAGWRVGLRALIISPLIYFTARLIKPAISQSHLYIRSMYERRAGGGFRLLGCSCSCGDENVKWPRTLLSRSGTLIKKTRSGEPKIRAGTGKYVFFAVWTKYFSGSKYFSWNILSVEGTEDPGRNRSIDVKQNILMERKYFCPYIERIVELTDLVAITIK